MVQQLWKTVWQFFIKLKIELPYDPVNLLFRYTHTREMKIYMDTETCTTVVKAVLFLPSQKVEKTKCP